MFGLLVGLKGALLNPHFSQKEQHGEQSQSVTALQAQPNQT
jgi:hypothetical protein